MQEIFSINKGELTSALAHHCIAYLKAEAANAQAAQRYQAQQLEERELQAAARRQEAARAELLGYLKHLARG